MVSIPYILLPLYLFLCVWLPRNTWRKRERFGVLGHLYYLMLVSFNEFNFMNGFLQKLANCDIKKRFCAFSLKIWLFYQFETRLWLSHFLESLIFLSLIFYNTTCVKWCTKNFGCKSKTKNIDCLPRTKACLFAKKKKMIVHVQPMVANKQLDHERWLQSPNSRFSPSI